MTLMAANLLATVITPDTALLGGFHRLAIDDAGTGRANAPSRFPHGIPQRIVKPL